MTNRASRFADRVRAGRARRHCGNRLTAEPEMNRDRSRGHIRYHHRNEEGRNATRSLFHELATVELRRFESADSCSEVDRRAIRVDRSDHFTLFDRFDRRGERELSAAIRVARVFCALIFFWIKVFHFRR